MQENGPFLQAEELYELVHYLKQNITDDIIIYSGYKFEELKQMQSIYVDKILDLISVLIDGEYIDEQNDGIGIRGSSNQYIFFATATITRSCQLRKENYKHFAITDKYSW